MGALERAPYITFVPLLILLSLSANAQSPSIARMPDMPEAYVLRDWKAVARDFDAIVFDRARRGPHLPLIWDDHSRAVNDIDGFALSSYVGDTRQTPASNTHEALASLSAVLGSTLAGIDKAAYAAQLPLHYHAKSGIGLYLNRHDAVGDSFWYDIFPSLLFYQLYDHYPDTPGFHAQFIRTAEVWREVTLALGGASPNFDHTGYNFVDKRPVDRGWIEADVAAGIACISYLAHRKTGRAEFLETADWCLHWLDARSINPYYESLLPYGAYIAARSNAERGSTHDSAKLREWVLAGDNPRRWGAILEIWNGTPVHGLIGSVYPGYEFAFTMNTFQALGIMAPIVRYDESYAAEFAKWTLNVASNARYFYGNAWPPEAQSSYAWASKHDPAFSIAYEGLRKEGMTRSYADAEGRIDFPEGTRQRLIVSVRDVPRPHRIQIANSANGPFRNIFTFHEGQAVHALDISDPSPIWLRGAGEERLVETHLPYRPQVGGDPTVHGWGKTDLGVYGGAFVGFLAALVEPTNVPGILAIDPVATEVHRPASYPTRLLRNPHASAKTVSLPVGESEVDVYDALSNRFLQRKTRGQIQLELGPKATVLLVFCPSGGTITRSKQLRCNDRVIDWSP